MAMAVPSTAFADQPQAEGQAALEAEPLESESPSADGKEAPAQPDATVPKTETKEDEKEKGKASDAEAGKPSAEAPKASNLESVAAAGIGKPEGGADDLHVDLEGRPILKSIVSAAPAAAPEAAALGNDGGLAPQAFDGEWYEYTINDDDVNQVLRFVIEEEFGPGFDFTQIEKLRVSGSIGYRDFQFIREELTALTDLDISGMTNPLNANQYTLDHMPTLREVHLPANAAPVKQMLDGCTGLTTLWIGSTARTEGVIDLTGIAALNVQLFLDCSSIASVRLPDNAAVPQGMLSGCASLKTLVVGTGAPTENVVDLSGASSIDARAFSGCAAIESVRLPANATVPQSLFLGCTRLANLIVGDGAIPSGLIDLKGASSFGSEAFRGCTSITTARLPQNAAVADDLFAICSSMTTLYMGEDEPVVGTIDLTAASALGARAFDGCSSLDHVLLPANAEVPYGLLRGCTSLNELRIGDGEFIDGTIDLTGASSLAGGIFMGCTAIEKVRWPVGAEVMHDVFSDCTGLTALRTGTGDFVEGYFDLEGAAAPIGDTAFGRCIGIESLRLPDDAHLGISSFDGCTGLSELIMGDRYFKEGIVDLTNATHFGERAFQGCTSIDTVMLSADTTFDYLVFNDCASLSTIFYFGGDAPDQERSIFSDVSPDGILYYPPGTQGYDQDRFPSIEDWQFIPYALPSFPVDPQDEGVEEGDPVTFTASIAGTPAPTSRWQAQDDAGDWYDLTDDEMFSGTATDTLTIAAMSADLDGSMYRCTAESILGSAISEEATLYLVEAPTIKGPRDHIVIMNDEKATVGPFTATGIPEPTISKASGPEQVTWNDVTSSLDIAPGMAKGDHEVVVRADNGIGEPATLTLTITVMAIEEADASQNRVIISQDPVFINTPFTFTAIGHLADRTPEVQGDERFIARDWRVNPRNGSFATDEPPFTAETTLKEVGSHTLIVTFQLQRWDGRNWNDVDGEVDEKSIDFTATENKPVDPVDPVDPKKPDDPATPIKPTDGSGTQGTKGTGGTTQPKLGDSVLAVSLATTAAAAALVVASSATWYLKRRKDAAITRRTRR